MSTGTKKSQKGRSTGAVQAWGDNLRKSGTGISTESKGSSMTGLNKSRTKDMSYASTSHYLRQLAGAEKARKSFDSTQSMYNIRCILVLAIYVLFFVIV